MKQITKEHFDMSRIRYKYGIFIYPEDLFDLPELGRLPDEIVSNPMVARLGYADEEACKKATTFFAKKHAQLEDGFPTITVDESKIPSGLCCTDTEESSGEMQCVYCKGDILKAIDEYFGLVDSPECIDEDVQYVHGKCLFKR